MVAHLFFFIIILYSYFIIHLLNCCEFLLDLLDDDPILNLDKMINLDPEQLKTETTGEHIIRQLQEYLLSKVDPNERAVLPEDKIQRLLVSVSIPDFKSCTLLDLTTKCFFLFPFNNHFPSGLQSARNSSPYRDDSNHVEERCSSYHEGHSRW